MIIIGWGVLYLIGVLYLVGDPVGEIHIGQDRNKSCVCMASRTRKVSTQIAVGGGKITDRTNVAKLHYICFIIVQRS